MEDDEEDDVDIVGFVDTTLLIVVDRNVSRLYRYSSLDPDGPVATAMMDAAWNGSSNARFENAGLSGVPKTNNIVIYDKCVYE